MGEKGDYIELVGRESDTNAGVRSRGFHDVLDKYPGLKMVGPPERQLGPARGVPEDGDAHSGQPPIKGVIAGNDTMALGAMAALKAAGLGKVIVVGFDGSPDAIAVHQGGRDQGHGAPAGGAHRRLAVEQAHRSSPRGRPASPRSSRSTAS